VKMKNDGIKEKDVVVAMEKSEPSFNIMNLLAQSVAKINAMEDLNLKKRKLETKMPSTSTCLDTAAIVYHYLRVVSPSIASALLDIYPEVDMDCTITLDEVVQQEWKIMTDEAAVQSLSKYKDESSFLKGNGIKDDKSKTLPNEVKMKNDDIKEKDVVVAVADNRSQPRERNKGKSKGVGKSCRKMCQRVKRPISPREDSIILRKMKEMGDDLNMKELAEELGRPIGTVEWRVKKLKSGDSSRHTKLFSLAEDEAILEKVLPGLQTNKLHKLVLPNDGSLNEFAAALGRPNKGPSIALRWVRFLQPWIMQHYAGTLNLDIRMMLVNHLAETYENRESIDWDAVADKSEFAGNTASKLKFTFLITLAKATRSLDTEISWEQIQDRCKEYISQTKRRNSKKAEIRRFQVIRYFENYVKKQELVDYI